MFHVSVYAFVSNDNDNDSKSTGFQIWLDHSLLEQKSHISKGE